MPPTAVDLRQLPLAMQRELRSDHAGELGAVWIYRGILAVSRDANLRRFAEEHMASETRHLVFFETHLPQSLRTRLAPLWRLAGWLLGALPALLGPVAVYRTVQSVESFVDHHYATQIDMLADHPEFAWLREQLSSFRDDELAHRDDAATRVGGKAPGGLWAALVQAGSVAGAGLARRV